MDYKALGALGSGPLEAFVVASAVLSCLATAGLAFGFSALLPQLLRDKAFHELCAHSEVCELQISSLTGIFALTTSLLNVAALPSGALLDHLGPRITAVIFCSSVALGCTIFAERSYEIGFLLLGVSGPVVFNCTLSFGNLFPSRRGFITASLVGCFDASSAIFALLALCMDSGLSLSEAFKGYAFIPALCALMALTWPTQPVEEPDEEASPGGRSLASICFSLEFAVLAYTVSITMVCINFFIATVFPQMLAVTGNLEDAQRLNSQFAMLLPLGGVASIPAVGLVIDHLGPRLGYLVLLAAYGCFTLCSLAFTAGYGDGFATLSFIFFAFVRPLFYSLNPAFCGDRFGFTHFGTVFGLLFTVAGLCNLSVQPLATWAQAHGFQRTTLLLAIGQLSSVLLLGVSRRRSRPKMQDDVRRSFSVRSFSMRQL